MSSVTFPEAVGGNGSTVSDDANPATGLAQGGHRTRFVPALAQLVAIAQAVKTFADNSLANRNATAEDAATAVEARDAAQAILELIDLGALNAAVTATSEDAVQTALDRLQTVADRIQTGLDVIATAATLVLTEAARDAASTNADVKADVAEGLDDVAESEQFTLVSPDGLDLIRYRKDPGPVATEVARTPTSAAAGVLPQRNRIFTLPQKYTFAAGEVAGAIGPNMLDIVNLVWDIGSSGEIAVTANTSETNARLFWNGFERQPGQPLLAKARVSFANTGVTCRAIIAIGTPGDSSTLRQYLATQTGALGQQNTASNTNAPVFLGFASTFGNDEIVELTLALDATGTGYLYAESPNGTGCLPISGAPAGRVFVGARTGSTWTVHSFSAEVKDATVSPTAVRLERNEINVLPSDLTKGEAIGSGTAIDNTWRFQTEGSVVDMGDQSGAALNPGALRTFIPISSGVHTKAAWHFYLSNPPARDRTNNDRFSFVQFNSGGTEVARTEIYYARLKPGSNTGVIDIEPTATRLLYFLGTPTSASAPLAVSQASLAFSAYPGFRPYKAEALEGGLESRVEKLEGQLGNPTPVLIGWKILPNFPLDRNVNQFPSIGPSLGFTVTGATEIKTSSWKGCRLLADDGRLNEQSGGPGAIYNPHVHILDRNHDRILRSFPVGVGDRNHTAQGVDTDTLTAQESFWVALGAGRTIRHYHLYGGSAGAEIGADVIDFDALSISPNPNGLAFDPDEGSGRGALWCGGISGTTVWLIDCDPAASPRIIRTITLPVSGADQFQLVKKDGARRLLYSQGGNGSSGNIYSFNLESEAAGALALALPLSTAIEGFVYNPISSEADVYNDNYYHSTNATPRFNMVATYRLAELPL